MSRRLLVILATIAGFSHATGAWAEQSCPTDPDAMVGVNSLLYDQRSLEHALIAEQTYKAATLALEWAKTAPGDALLPDAPLPATAKPGKLAVILDVDETVLDNSPAQGYMIKSKMAYCEGNWDRWIEKRAASPVPGAVVFTQAAQRAGVEVFYVTNRDCKKEETDTGACKSKQYTMDVMKRLGFARADDPDAFLLKNEKSGWLSDKSSRRAKIAADHRVIMMIGDQLTDFVSPATAEKIWSELKAPIVSVAVAQAQKEPSSAPQYRNYQAMIGTRWFLLPNAQYGLFVDRFKSTDDRLVALQAANIGPQSLTIATWNAEWFMDPAEFDRVAARGCSSGGANPTARSLPCDVAKEQRRSPDDIKALQRYTERLNADIIALQEVDGPGAAKLLFPHGYSFCFSMRTIPNAQGGGEAPVQDVGFAVRDGIPYDCKPAWREIGLYNSVRWAAQITVNPGTASAIDLIAFHLKSGCARDPLNSGSDNCNKLREQTGLLQKWLAARPDRAPPLIMLGDFNRELEVKSASDAVTNMWPNLDVPNGGERDLTAISETLPYQKCDFRDQFSGYIDQIVVSRSLVPRLGTLSRVTHDRADVAAKLKLSDHCAVKAELLPSKQ